MAKKKQYYYHTSHGAGNMFQEMIIHGQCVSLCQQEKMTIEEGVQVIAGYIYCMKGVTLRGTIDVSNTELFERALTIACAYFTSESEKASDLFKGIW